MKSFKQFILEAERYSGPPVNSNQSIKLDRPGSTLPKGSKLVPVNTSASKPKPADAVQGLFGQLIKALERK